VARELPFEPSSAPYFAVQGSTGLVKRWNADGEPAAQGTRYRLDWNFAVRRAVVEQGGVKDRSEVETQRRWSISRRSEASAQWQFAERPRHAQKFILFTPPFHWDIVLN